MPMLDRLYIPVSRELERVEEVLASEIGSGIDMVDSISRFAVNSGGKRIRPAIFLLATRISGGACEGLASIGAALEMIHTASLLHDDVIDDAALRRGRHSVRGRWGNQASILVGDFLWSRALDMIIKDNRRDLVDIVSTSVGKIIRGELLEISHKNDHDMRPEIYMEIIQGKTAELFSVAARGGAIVSGIGSAFEDALASYGFYLGQAFQLADDALDYVADGTCFGKASGQDLKEGRLTYPLIMVLKKAGDEEKKFIREALVSSRVTDGQFESVSEMICRHGGIDETMILANDLVGRAKKFLEVFKPSIERDALYGIADHVVASVPTHKKLTKF